MSMLEAGKWTGTTYADLSEQAVGSFSLFLGEVNIQEHHKWAPE